MSTALSEGVTPLLGPDEIEIVVEMEAVEPCEHTKGWVECRLIDKTGELSWVRLLEFITEEMLVTLDHRFVGFDSNGGIFDYDRDFGSKSYTLKIKRPKRKWRRA